MYVGPWQEYKLAKFRSETLDALEDVAQQFPELQDIFRRRAAQERERRQYSASSRSLPSNVPRTAPAASSRRDADALRSLDAMTAHSSPMDSPVVRRRQRLGAAGAATLRGAGRARSRLPPRGTQTEPPPDRHPLVERRLAEVERMKQLYLSGGGSGVEFEVLVAPAAQDERAEVAAAGGAAGAGGGGARQRSGTPSSTSRRSDAAEAAVARSSSPIRRWGGGPATPKAKRPTRRTTPLISPDFGVALTPSGGQRFPMSARRSRGGGSGSGAPPNGLSLSPPLRAASAISAVGGGDGGRVSPLNDDDVESLRDWTAQLDIAGLCDGDV